MSDNEQTETISLTREQLLAQFFKNEDLMNKVVTLFIEKTPEYIGDIEEAVLAENSEKIHKTAHTFKGAVGNLTNTGPFETALKLEMMGRENNIQDSKAVFEELKFQAFSFKDHLVTLS